MPGHICSGYSLHRFKQESLRKGLQAAVMVHDSQPSNAHESSAVAARYMPLGVSASHGKTFSRIEALSPLGGCVAAAIHTYYYGLAFGTLLVAGFVALLTGLGVTVGFHRLFTHRSFETYPAVRVALAILGSMSGQGHFFLWVATHRRHHRYSDHHGDPHTPHRADGSALSRLRNFYHAHFGWSLADQLTDECLHYIPDLTDDRALRRVQRAHLLWLALGLALPALFMYWIAGTLQAAIGGLLWGGFVRLTFTNQTTYAVNSVCHLWGRRPYDSADQSRNNFFVALLALGEGWHNNHHAFPTSARHGHGWQQPDLSWTFIKLLRACGLAWHVKTPSPAQLQEKSRANKRKRATKSSVPPIGLPPAVGLTKTIAVGKA